MVEKNIQFKQGLSNQRVITVAFTKLYFSSCKSTELTNQVSMACWGALLVSCGGADESGGALRAVIHSKKFSRSADAGNEPRMSDLPRVNNVLFPWRALEPHQLGSIPERRGEPLYGGHRELLCRWLDFNQGLNMWKMLLHWISRWNTAQWNVCGCWVWRDRPGKDSLRFLSSVCSWWFRLFL